MSEEREIIQRLREQDKTLEQILWILKGSENLPIEGVLPQLRRISGEIKSMDDEIKTMIAWKESVIASKGKLDIKEAVKWIATAGVGVGVITSIYHLIQLIWKNI